MNVHSRIDSDRDGIKAPRRRAERLRRSGPGTAPRRHGTAGAIVAPCSVSRWAAAIKVWSAWRRTTEPSARAGTPLFGEKAAPHPEAGRAVADRRPSPAAARPRLKSASAGAIGENRMRPSAGPSMMSARSMQTRFASFSWAHTGAAAVPPSCGATAMVAGRRRPRKEARALAMGGLRAGPRRAGTLPRVPCSRLRRQGGSGNRPASGRSPQMSSYPVWCQGSASAPAIQARQDGSAMTASM